MTKTEIEKLAHELADTAIMVKQAEFSAWLNELLGAFNKLPPWQRYAIMGSIFGGGAAGIGSALTGGNVLRDLLMGIIMGTVAGGGLGLAQQYTGYGMPESSPHLIPHTTPGQKPPGPASGTDLALEGAIPGAAYGTAAGGALGAGAGRFGPYAYARRMGAVKALGDNTRGAFSTSGDELTRRIKEYKARLPGASVTGPYQNLELAWKQYIDDAARHETAEAYRQGGTGTRRARLGRLFDRVRGYAGVGPMESNIDAAIARGTQARMSDLPITMRDTASQYAKQPFRRIFGKGFSAAAKNVKGRGKLLIGIPAAIGAAALGYRGGRKGYRELQQQGLDND